MKNAPSFPRRRRSPRGISLISAMMVMAILLASITGLLYYAHQARSRANKFVRSAQGTSCAEAGLQIARSYFGRNFAQWNQFLADPNEYNPVKVSPLVTIPGSTAPANPFDPVLRGNRPELFADLDGDNRPDVYIYIRDNEDEFSPNPNDWTRDNDQNVIVGAICISSTMGPKPTDDRGTVLAKPQLASAESLLSYNVAGRCYGQALCGDGTGNFN